MSEFREGMDAAAPRGLPPETTSEERTWAAIAHVSTLVTLLVGIGTAGVAWLLLPFVPLAIYFMYRDKSRYVALHAAQAFAIQILLSFGYILLAVAVGMVIAVFWIVTLALIAILIGLILVPFALLITVVLGVGLAVVPFIGGAFSIIATIECANGRDYRYPYLGRWVADWLERNSTASSAPVRGV